MWIVMTRKLWIGFKFSAHAQSHSVRTSVVVYQIVYNIKHVQKMAKTTP